MHVFHDDFQLRPILVGVFVHPLIVLQSSLEVHWRPFAQVLRANFGDSAKRFQVDEAYLFPVFALSASIASAGRYSHFADVGA